MVDSIEWLRTLIFSYPALEYLIIFVVATFGGELALFVLGFLSAQGILPMFPIILFSFLGAFAPNALWFFLGETNAVGKLTSYRHTDATFSIITEAVQRVSRGSHLLALIIIKFLVGTPVLLIMYTHKTALTFKQFVFYQGVATLLSILVIMPIGYYSGRGFSYVSEISENLYSAIGFLILVIFVIVVFQVWFEKKFTNPKDQLLP